MVKYDKESFLFLIILVIFLGCSQKAESPEFQFDITEDTLETF